MNDIPPSSNNDPHNSNLQLTSTTAPGITFPTRQALAQHYKSDWHRYNLKRREANLDPLCQDEFMIRLDAAKAVRADREGKTGRLGVRGKDHLKDKKKKNTTKKMGRMNRNNTEKETKEIISTKKEKIECVKNDDDKDMEEDEPEIEDEVGLKVEEEVVEEEEEEAVIDPTQSLFDSHISPSVSANISYMYNRYGFFIPDKEHLTDKRGLIGYCHEKIKLGHVCLYCQRIFQTVKGCIDHMVDDTVRHCKIKYEAGVDLDEFDVFYDFSKVNAEYLGESEKRRRRRKKRKEEEEGDAIVEDGDNDEAEDDSDGEWEDMETEDDDNDAEDDDMIHAEYKNTINSHGYDITPLGELILPSGRIIGHRDLSVYYKQRFAPIDENSSRDIAVSAARRAGDERLIEGRVYGGGNENGNDEPTLSTLTLAKMGLVAGAAKGREGRGILVSTSGRGGHNGTVSASKAYTALSYFRYKAAIKQYKKGEWAGRRLRERNWLPINKMDKKANRLFNNVSVAHAKR